MLKEMFSFDLLASGELRMQVSGMYKHSEKVQIDEKNMLTWLVLNWLQTSKSSVSKPYNEGNALAAAKEIAGMANNQTMDVDRIKECLNNYGISYLEVENEYSTDPREKDANQFARQMLIPDEVWNRIVGVGCKSLSPYNIVKTIATEAQRSGISPSIAISRYKHDTGWYRTASYKSPKIFA